MIGYLKGKILLQNEFYLIIDVNGVGYKVETSKFFSQDINNNTTLIELFIYTYVREDAIRLFGFETQFELETFEKLINVSGVGPKSALTLLKIIDYKEIINGIKTNDLVNYKVPGIGKKTLEKIVLELKNSTFIKNIDIPLGVSSSSHISNNVVDALMSLGFKEKEIIDSSKELEFTDKSEKEIILEILKILRKK